MAEEIITVKNLSASLNGRQILKDVTFSAFEKEITVILGASGCGKTTMMKHLIGLYPVRRGSIRIMGRSLKDMDEDAMTGFTLNMGVLFQNGALLNSLTVAENVAIPLEHHTHLPPEMIGDLVRMKLHLMGLSHAHALYPTELSGGMRKRAALARAISLDPPLLFCDEPSAGLDPITLYSLDQLILKMKRQLGMTIVLITHEPSTIFRVADRVIFMDRGTVLDEGSLEDVTGRDDPQVREFFDKARRPI